MESISLEPPYQKIIFTGDSFTKEFYLLSLQI